MEWRNSACAGLLSEIITGGEESRNEMRLILADWLEERGYTDASRYLRHPHGEWLYDWHSKIYWVIKTPHNEVEVLVPMQDGLWEYIFPDDGSGIQRDNDPFWLGSLSRSIGLYPIRNHVIGSGVFL